MSQPSKERLLDLLLEASTAELPEPALLARYVSDPEALSDQERSQVERAVQESPLVADELRTLRGFDFSEISRVTAEVRAERRRAFWERVREWLTPRSAVWLALTAAGVAAAIIYPQLASRTPSGPAPASHRVAHAPPALPPVPVSPRLAAEQPPPPAPAPIAAPEPAPFKEPEPLVAGQEEPPAPRQERAEPRHEAPARKIQPPPREQDASAPEPAPEAKPEPILLAMAMPEYEKPLDAEARFRVSPTLRSIGRSETVSLHALAPSHVARTSQSQPDLYWHLSALPSGGTLEFVIEPSDASPSVIETDLSRPTQPGLQRIRLSELGVELPPDRELRWSVAYHGSTDDPSRAYALGWIRRVSLSADLSERIARAQPGDVPSLYAKAGIWYDALASVLDLAERVPGDARVQQAYRSLLEQAEVEGVVE